VKAHPTQRSAQRAGIIVIYMQRVGTAQIQQRAEVCLQRTLPEEPRLPREWFPNRAASRLRLEPDRPMAYPGIVIHIDFAHRRDI